MSARRSTLKALAAELNLSVPTVSRALGGYQDISQKTRDRVALKAREMGYVPNSAARMLVSGRSDFVGIVVPVRGPHLVDAFLGELVTGIGEQLTEHGVDLFLATATKGKSEMDVLRHVVESGKVDGLLLNRIAKNDERIAFLKSRNFPFIAHGRMLDGNDTHWIDTDGHGAFHEAFEALYSLGHRRFGLLSIDEQMGFRLDRESGLQAAIALKDDPSLNLTTLRASRFDNGALAAAAHELLTQENRPTAILCVIDDVAIIAMQEAAKLGLAIPDDLSIIGFDNLPTAALTPPGLSTFDQKIRHCAREMADMLMHVIRKQPEEAQTKLVKTEFLARGSHGPAPKA